MQCRLIRDLTDPAGTVLSSPPHRVRDIVALVQMGCAEPADEECDKAAGMTPERIAIAAHAYERVHRGIHPDDYEAYEAGLMTGYNPDGSFIPGPNAEREGEPESNLWLPEDYGNG
jgi:hypothetical protein